MISTRLKELRKSHSITQEQLAAALAIERSSIGKYESPTKPVTPPPDVLLRIAKYFGVSVDYLMGNTPPSIAPKVREPASGELTPDEQMLLAAYRKASEDDRAVVAAALRKYHP